MIGLELLEKKLVEDGYCKVVTEHSRKVIRGCLAILANADTNVYVNIDEAKTHLKSLEADINNKEFCLKAIKHEIQRFQDLLKLRVNEINDKNSYINKLYEALEKCETAEGRDRLKIAQMFVNSVNVDTKYDNTAFIVSLGAILAGKTIAAIPTLKKINKKLDINIDEWEDVETV